MSIPPTTTGGSEGLQNVHGSYFLEVEAAASSVPEKKLLETSPCH